MKRTHLLVWLFLACAPTLYAASGPWDEPAAALAGQVSALMGPGPARIVLSNASSIPDAEVPVIRKLMEQDLKQHGISAGGADSANQLRITLSENARERLWVAEVMEGNSTRVAMVKLPLGELPVAQTVNGIVLHATPLLTSNEPVLAADDTNDGLLVLQPEKMTLYRRAGGGWMPASSAPIAHKGALARDPRGVLLLTGNSIRAWLAGVQCTGQIGDSGSGAALALQCSESDDPWPLHMGGVAETAGLKAFYNANRNYFTGVVAPAIGVELSAFYSGAVIPRAGNGAALLLLAVDGKAQLVENGAVKTISGARDWGSDFAVLASGCGSGTQILAAGSGPAAQDSIRAYQLPALEAQPASAPLAINGSVTAMWPATDARSVFAAVRTANNQYEVDRVTANCN